MRTKRLLVFICALVVTSSLHISFLFASSTGTWKQDSTGWWFRYDNGSYPVSKWDQIAGTWYYFDSDGYLKKGWLNYGKSWYYLTDYGMLTSRWLGNYYLKSDGRMAASEWVDGADYYVNSSGCWVPDRWEKNNHGWWYRYGDGSYPYNQLAYINKVVYCFDKTGYLKAGWYKDSAGDWRYFTENGMVTNTWVGNYYLNSVGEMAKNTWVGNYYVDENGKWIPGAKH